jgi:hypothetical protein
MIRQQTVFVANHGDEPFRDRYNGEDFTIPAGGVEEMLVETAELCLGFGEEDKTRVIRRLGLAFTLDDMPKALERLNSFSFHMSEKEARAHVPSNESPSSAPRGVETGGGILPLPPGVGNGGKVGPLQKLAAAQAHAG